MEFWVEGSTYLLASRRVSRSSDDCPNLPKGSTEIDLHWRYTNKLGTGPVWRLEALKRNNRGVRSAEAETDPGFDWHCPGRQPRRSYKARHWFIVDLDKFKIRDASVAGPAHGA
jgi:hypothetical protein